MSKPSEHIILVPGPSSWEIWTGQPESGYTLHSDTGCLHAGEITAFPQGDVTMAFPVKSLTAVSLRVNSEDDALFPDLAALHAERLGLRTDPMSGQLSDVFVVAREPENTSLVSVFLRGLGEGDLPIRGPKEFDVSARMFPVEGDVLVVWREFGRWVFAVYQGGKLLYCQATAEDAPAPTEALAREIRLAVMQLSMQGFEIRPERLVVWSSDASLDVLPLSDLYQGRVEVVPRPAPAMPDPLSKLLPADVRAARRAAQKKLQTTLSVAAVAVAYLGVIGWFGYGLWKDKQETAALIRAANAATPDAEAYTEHIARWEELSHVVDLNNAPVDILHRISLCIPPNSGLRLKTADVSATDIKLIGEAPALPAVNTFSLKLSKANDLSQFTWQTPEPNQSTRGWEFVFSGEVPVPVETQP